MNQNSLPTFKTPSQPSEFLLTFNNKSSSNNLKENNPSPLNLPNSPHKRLSTRSGHKADSALSYDKQKENRCILIPCEMGYRQGFGSEKTENGQRLPQSATSNHSKRTIKVRSGSSSKIPITADWSNGLHGIAPLGVGQNGSENTSYVGHDGEFQVSEAEGRELSSNSTAIFGNSGASDPLRKRNETNSGNESGYQGRSTPATLVVKEERSPMSAVEFSSNKSVMKPGSQGEMDSQMSNRYMEFTLSGFVKEDTVKSLENRSDSQKGMRRENQSLLLDLKKGNIDDQRVNGVLTSREDRERQRNIRMIRENSYDIRKNHHLGLPWQSGVVLGNKSMETSQERAKGLRRKEYEIGNTPFQEYGKSPRSRLILNLVQTKKPNYPPEHEKFGVKKLVEENTHLRKENDQKEELIGLLISALKQKEGNNNQDLSPTTLPNLDSYLSPKDNVQRFSFNRSRLTSAEKPFSSGTPNRFTHKSHGPVAPSRDGLSDIVSLERGKSNEAVRLFENSSAQSLKALAIPSSQKAQLITVIDQGRVQTVNEILSAKRVYSSPIPVHPEPESFSHYTSGFSQNRIAMQKSMMAKGNTPLHPLINVKTNGRLMMNYPLASEGKSEYESLPKLNMYEHEYGFQRRRSRECNSEYTLKPMVPEIKFLSMNNLDALGSQKMKDPTPLNGVFNPTEFISGTFQSKNFRVKSPGKREKVKYNSQMNLDSRIKYQEDLKYQSTCDIDSKTLLSSNRETDFPSLKVMNGLREVKSYGNLQKEVPQREGSRLQSMYKNNENREFGHMERVGKSAENVSKVKNEGGKKEKFPKEVFSMNIRRKFFC